MKIPINTEVLKKYDLSLGQFLVLLSGLYNLDYSSIQKELEERGLVERNLFSDFPPVLSENSKNLVANIIVESDNRLLDCPIKDFETLAKKLQECYPDGIKPGKTYSWRGDTETIAQKLRALVARCNFTFTEEEAVDAVREYVSYFCPPYTYMHTLRNFLLYSKGETESLFMTIIENNRAEQDGLSGGDIGDLDDALG